MTLDDVLATEVNNICIATGAFWRSDGVGLTSSRPLAAHGCKDQTFTPDDIMAGRLPQGHSIVYDDDHYYLASVVAEELCARNIPVTFVTPESKVSAWCDMTAEQPRIHKRLLDLGVNIVTNRSLSSFDGECATFQCVYSEDVRSINAEALVTVTCRQPNDKLFQILQENKTLQPDQTPTSISRIGDCEAPAIIAGAVFSGHRYAREFDTDVNSDARIKYDRVVIEGK